MRALIQRVSRAQVAVDAEVVGAIDAGMVALIGVTHTDAAVDVTKMADKIANLRIFDDDEGVMNRSVLDSGGQVLVVSQFTLYGDTAKGRRPSWIAAARPEVAEPLIDDLVEELRGRGLVVETGRFRTEMAVELVNDGPVTVLVEVPTP